MVLTSNGYVEIEDIEVGQRVITVAESDIQDSSTAVDPYSWRLVKLLMPNPDNSDDIIELSCLRPLAWLAEAGIELGIQIEFVLHEMGLEGTAKVVSIEPCPTIEEGEGRVVLSTVTHLNGHLMEIRFDGADQPLQPTDTHQFYSEDREAWTPAGSLSAGEQLRTATGSIEITSTSKQSGIQQVFNIEVEGEHWYYVSELDVLSHNMCAKELTTLQKGGHTLSNRTLKQLNLSKDQGKRAIEGLKNDLGLPPNFHQTKILNNGNVVHTNTKEVLGNLFDYVD